MVYSTNIDGISGPLHTGATYSRSCIVYSPNGAVSKAHYATVFCVCWGSLVFRGVQWWLGWVSLIVSRQNAGEQ